MKEILEVFNTPLACRSKTLEVFNTEVEKSGSTITVTYCHNNFSGTCIYKEVTTKGLNKPIKQNFLVLTSTDMGDVIEYIHKNIPLSSEDLFVMDKLIRDHSLLKVKDHLNNLF